MTRLAIGAMSRACGLTVSALRFYGDVDVLVPAWVDPQTGYRWYDRAQVADARLVARLRRVGVPIADIRRVLAHRSDPVLVEQMLAVHLRRLEDGLADARRELSTVRSLLALEDNAMTQSTTEVTTSGAELAAALAAVRYAVGSDPELPMLHGVLFDHDGHTLRLVATDRYRLAITAVATTGSTGPVRAAVAPIALIDAAFALAGQHPGPLTLRISGDRFVVETAGGTVDGPVLTYEFPDYRRLLRTDAARRVSLDRAALRAALSAGPTQTMRRDHDGVDYETSVLAVDADGTLTVAAADDTGGALRIGVNREFLLQALDAGGDEQLLLDLDGPITPLVLRDPGRPDSLAMLMPVRLTAA